MVTPATPIAVIGEALVDVFPNQTVPGGAPFNVARHLALFGKPPLMVTRVGDDLHAQVLRAEFDRTGLPWHGVQHDGALPTGHVTVRLNGTHHTFEISASQAWDHIDAAGAIEAVRQARPAIVCFGTLAQREPVSRGAVHAMVNATTARRFCDVNLRTPFDGRDVAAVSLTLADTVKVNDDELRQLLAWFAPGGDAHALMRRFHVARLVITRGASGWSCLDSVIGELHGPSPTVNVADTVGAGDAFSAVMLLGDVSGWPLAQSLDRASRFAADICTVRGAVPADAALHRDTLARWA